MLLLPATLLVRADLGHVEAAQRQLEGIAPAQSAVALIHVTQQHRGISALVLGGDTAAAANRRAKQAEVDRGLAQLTKAVATLQDAPLASATARLADDWRALAGKLDAAALDSARSLELHSALIQQEIELIQDIARVSGIVLVPEAASYFLQSAALEQLPRLIEAFGQARGLGATLLARGSATPQERAAISQLGATVASTFRDARKSLELAVKDDATARAAIGNAMSAATAAAQEGFKLVDERVVQAQKLEFPAAQYYEVMTRATEAQFKLIEAANAALGAALEREVQRSRTEIMLVLLACGALALLGAWLMWAITRITAGAVASALHMAQAVAAGDLTQSVAQAGRDEVGQLLRALERMKDSLAVVVATARGNAENVATASAQIAQGNLDLSQRTEEQASALQETAASMEQLGTAVTHNAENARQASRLAQEASAVAAEGGAVVGQVVEMMKGINGSSRRIADIIGVIDGIAFQTNILALNAAVEAARAGEQGRGFAVVASEVRSLAQRSSEAAKEIKALIGSSVDQVEEGSALVQRAGTTIGNVVESIQRVNVLMGEISRASAEQSSGVAQVGTAVGQIDQTTQQNAALVEQSAAAAESLKVQAGQLVAAVAVFKIRAAERSSDEAAGRPADASAAPRGATPGLRATLPAAPAQPAARAPARGANRALPAETRVAEAGEWAAF
ncbi:MAG: nitrate- and nitrite sensing domain-containing protein [Rubrivivax sp.]|nr:nitrate- and nitrite sensing domain-containing protein [Rubrivivax sp.]